MRVTHNEEKHFFEAFTDEGEHMGKITYVPKDGDIAANHTWTEKKFRNQGVAQAMLDAMADYARQSGKKIIPICSYVIGAFEREAARYRDVMKG